MKVLRAIMLVVEAMWVLFWPTLSMMGVAGIDYVGMFWVDNPVLLRFMCALPCGMVLGAGAAYIKNTIMDMRGGRR